MAGDAIDFRITGSLFGGIRGGRGHRAMGGPLTGMLGQAPRFSRSAVVL
jgi:hypothetical protein